MLYPVWNMQRFTIYVYWVFGYELSKMTHVGILSSDKKCKNQGHFSALLKKYAAPPSIMWGIFRNKISVQIMLQIFMNE